MKKYACIFNFALLLFLFQQAFATVQTSDYLIYEGDTLKMRSFPLESYLEAHPNPIYETLFESVNTACWRGYVAYWTIYNDSLFLSDIWGESLDDRSVDKSLIFTDVNEKQEVFASWVSDDLLTVFGERLFLNTAFDLYSYERVFSVRSGKVIAINDYDNTKTSTPMVNMEPLVRNYIQYNINYSNLANVPEQEAVLTVEFNVNDDGTIGDARVITIDEDYPEDMKAEAIRVVKSIPQWDVFYHLGKPMTFPEWLNVRFSERLRQAQPFALQPHLTYYEKSINDDKDGLRKTPNVSNLLKNIASSYFELAQKSHDLTAKDTRYDSLYLQMYRGDSNVLWHYRCRYAADSALKYYYLAWPLESEQTRKLRMYYDIRQLEMALKVTPNPDIQLPSDTLGRYFDSDMFLTLPESWLDDFNSIDRKYLYLSCNLVERWGKFLAKVKEPTLYPSPLPGTEENLRVILLQKQPARAPIILIRVDISKNQAVIHWKVASPGRTSRFDTEGVVEEGSRTLTQNEVKQFRELLDNVNLSPKQPLDEWYNGSQCWFFEHRTADFFEAIDKVDPPQCYRELGVQLIKWCNLNLDEQQ